jgi:hypothetical protein
MKFGVNRAETMPSKANTSNTAAVSKESDTRIANSGIVPDHVPTPSRQLNESEPLKSLKFPFRTDCSNSSGTSVAKSPAISANFSLRSYSDYTGKSGRSVMPPVLNMKSRTRRFLPRIVYGFAGENDLPNKWYQSVPHFFRVFGVSRQILVQEFFLIEEAPYYRWHCENKSEKAPP